MTDAWTDPRPSSGCSRSARPRVELAERDEDRAGLDDRVDAEVRARAVRGLAGHLDLRPDEALVRDGDGELGRLGDDRGVGLHRAQRLLHADARVLLVGDRGDHDVAGQALRAASRQAISAAARPAFMSYAPRPYRWSPSTRGVCGSVMPSTFTVSRCAQSRSVPAAAGAARADEDARAGRRVLQDLGLEPLLAPPTGDERRDLALARAARDEVGVDGVDRDEAGEQVDDVGGHRR